MGQDAIRGVTVRYVPHGRAPGLSMRIAVQGCGHGDLHAIYRALAALEARTGDKADLLLVCGDFQAIRHARDLATLACPPKYRRMGDFADYWSGRRVAPVPTIFIGGNHEASRHLWELYHGGWVAPRIFFLGYSGVVRVGGEGGVRIGGVSGLYHPAHYRLGYFEAAMAPEAELDEDTKRSIYHTRELEVAKLGLLQQSAPLDIMLSHEWPHRIYEHGNVQRLLKAKPYFRDDIHGKGIGAPPLASLLQRLKPRRWLAAHMHVEFEATVVHEDGSTTDFLALDKCLPHRKHLRIINLPDVPAPVDPLQIEYDDEWLAIVRAADPFVSLSRQPVRLSAALLDGSLDLAEHRAYVQQLKAQHGGRLVVPKKYEKPADRPGRITTIRQTQEFCRLLDLVDRWTPVERSDSSSTESSPPVDSTTAEENADDEREAKVPRVHRE